MNEQNIEKIKTRASILHKLMKIVFMIGIVVLGAAFIACIYFTFASPERFTAVQGNMNWSLRYTVNGSSHFFINAPYKILQNLDTARVSAKNAFITIMVSAMISVLLILCGMKQVLNILKSTANDVTPFIQSNAKSLKKLAYTILIYSIAADLIANILCWIFVTKIFYVDLTNIHLNGVLIGALIFIVADIFQYGAFLQEEFDTTL